MTEREHIKFSDDANVREILIQGFARLSEDMTELRVDMASVQATNQEMKQTRHDLRNEMNDQFGLLRLEHQRLREAEIKHSEKLDRMKDSVDERINSVKSDIDQRKGRDAALGWIGSGSGLIGLVAAFFAIVRSFSQSG